MRSVAELINVDDHAWPLVEQWLRAGGNQIEIHAASRVRGERALTHVQVTTRSPLGAVALEVDHVTIEHGWLRLLGAGSESVRGLVEWNPAPAQAGFMMVAHDALGGFFALNGGALAGATGEVAYFAPDTLEWEALDMSYTEFVAWSGTDQVGRCYSDYRWPDWERECSVLNPDQGLSVYPFLWAKGPSIEERSRRPAAMSELWALAQDIRAQINL